MPRPPEDVPGYRRELHRDGARTLIQSVCEYCGTTFIDSVPQLGDVEREHREHCTKRKGAPLH